MPSMRQIFLLPLIVSLGSLLSCQDTATPTAPTQEASSSYTVALSGLPSSSYPDSATWVTMKDSGKATVQGNAASGSLQATMVPGSSLTSKDTVWLELWTRSLLTRRVPYLLESGTLKAQKNGVVTDTIATSLLQLFAGLQGKDTAIGLVGLYAQRLLAEDARFAGFPNNVPRRLTANLLRKELLRQVVDSSFSLSRLRIFGIDSASARALFADLLAAKNVNPADTLHLFHPFRILTDFGPSGISLVPGSAALPLDGLVAWSRGLSVTMTSSILTTTGVDQEHFALTLTRPIASGDTSLSLSSNAKLLATSAAPSGQDTISLLLVSQLKDTLRLRLPFTVGASAATKYEVVRKAPVAQSGTVLPFATDSLNTQWCIRNASLINPDSVTINGIKARQLSDSTWGGNIWIPPTGQLSTLTFRVVGKDGSNASDLVLVTRMQDTVKPVIASDTNTKLRSGTFKVWLSTATKGASIRYTLDGTEPTSSSPLFADSVTIDSTRTLKARAFKDSLVAGVIMALNYKLAVVIDVSAFADFTLFLLSDNSLWGVGNNTEGQLGLPGVDTAYKPMKIADSVLSMAVGDNFSMFVKLDNTLWTMGNNDSGQLGTNAYGALTGWKLPRQVKTGIKKAAARFYGSVVVLTTSGDLYGYGSNWAGQLGGGPSALRTTATPIASNVTDVRMGNAFIEFLKKDGTLWTLGYPYNHNLGIKIDTIPKAPIKVMDSVASLANSIAVSSLVKKIDGSLWAFGLNASGELGTGTTSPYDTPTKLTSPETMNVRAFAVEVDRGVFVSSTGNLYGMGSNSSSSLGGVILQHLNPSEIGNGKSFINCWLGYTSTLALAEDGTLWGMGDNSNFFGLPLLKKYEALTRIQF